MEKFRVHSTGATVTGELTGAVVRPYRAIAASTTLLATDYKVAISGSATLTLTLPTSTAAMGKEYFIIITTAQTGTLTLDAGSGNTLNATAGLAQTLAITGMVHHYWIRLTKITTTQWWAEAGSA